MCFPELGRFPCGRCFSDSQNLLLKLRVYRHPQGRVLGSHTGYAPIMLLGRVAPVGAWARLWAVWGPRVEESACASHRWACAAARVCLSVNGSVSVPISSNQRVI